ncbi:DNA cytosine methyltransferase [Pectobacterium brasiliense]|uniref:DNA cytosine methyltransferase n=1 Tax=Pectobacterium brasiliense TaxID=180957 RepID=UPI000B96B994|nr:DNA cytosine methyltransferase [Pectobacterium carotovorum]OYN52654.1 hypothetical protein B7L51_03880 [Pectobacterium carotovorum]
MPAYYNEIDPFAAEWLRNLIAAGHIAPGDVDERSIEDVTQDDLRNYTQCHFFAGIGVWSFALRQAGWPDEKRVWTGSCPCQPFSTAGKGDGFADERHLWPAFYHLIGQCRPPVIFGEQVASKAVNPWIDLVQSDMESLDYAVASTAFPSAGVGAPHIRDRNFWVANASIQRLQGAIRSREAEEEGASSRFDSECCNPLLLANSQCQQREKCISGLGEGYTKKKCGAAVEPSGHCMSHRLANTTGDRQQQRESKSTSTEKRRKEEPVARWQLSSGSERCSVSDKQSAAVQRITDTSCNATNGFWRDADWLKCRDGKWRPVEPSTFPLVDGITGGMGRGKSPLQILARRNRTGRLKGYGNAINAVAAAVFIETFIEYQQ